MANPLNKRLPRELRSNLGKYLGMLLIMAFATAFTSGFLLAAGSIETILGEMDERYAIEDGRFVCDFEPDDEAVAAVEKLGVSVTRDFYADVSLELASSSDDAQGITLRVFPSRTSVNLPEFAEGRSPESPDEVALDRVFATENHDLAIGDTVKIDGKDFTVCGFLTFPDYQALFEDNNSFMFNALTFSVGMLSDEGYHCLDSSKEVFNYSFTFDDQSLDLAQRTDVEEDMLDVLSDHDVMVGNFIDAHDNQGIGYALDDVQGDQVMWTVLLAILVVIMAFVFVVLTGATIEAESSVIGTMLASGWRKREIVIHYMVLPTIVGLLGVSIGLAIGVNLLTDPMKDLYYHSYSLPPYHTIRNWRVVFFTAVLPFLLLVGITLFGLMRKMRFTPLQFLRHEVATRKRNASLPLPDGLGYATRFRLRVLLRNAGHFVTLFFGILFASLLLLFGTCMLPVVQNYAGELEKTVAAPHEYVLKVPLELEGTDDEREMYAAALRLVEDKDRYNANRPAIDAARRLEDNKELMDAIERLQDNAELLDAVDRLQDDEELMDALERLQDGNPTMSDLMLLASLDDAKRADIDLLQNLDDATRADIDLIRNVDDATRADIDLVRTMDEDLLDDVRLAADIDKDAHVVNTQVNSDVSIAQAEKFAMGSIEIRRAIGGKMETVTVYGVQPNSAYWTDVPMADGHAVAGAGLIEKTEADVDASVEAHNPRTGESYQVKIVEATSNEADTSLYLSLDDFNRLFDNDVDYFNAYASGEELALDERYLAQHIQPSDMLKMSDQLETSMGKIMFMMMAMAIPVYLILVYLLTKTVIDRSARSISYMKVFGYRNREVNGLYIRPITYWVLFSLVASLPLIVALITTLLRFVFMSYAGNFPLIIPPERYGLLVLVGMVAYAVVAALHVRRIKAVPLELAMKVQE